MNYDSYMTGFSDGRILAAKAPTSPFLVFADKHGYSAPTFKHPTREAAEKEAKRLANLNPGVNYYVLGSVSVTNAPRVTASTRDLV